MTRAYIIGFVEYLGGPFVDAGIFLQPPPKICQPRGRPVLLRSIQGLDAVDAVNSAAALVRRTMPRLLDFKGMADAREP